MPTGKGYRPSLQWSHRLLHMESRDPNIPSLGGSQDGLDQTPAVEPARGKRGKGRRPKSPLGNATTSRSGSRSLESSPKVCLREDDSVNNGQLVDIDICVLSPAKDDLILKKLEDMMEDTKLSPSSREVEGKRPKVYMSPSAPSWNATLTKNWLQMALEEDYAPLLSRSAAIQRDDGLPLYRQTLQACEFNSLLELLKHPDINITSIEDKLRYVSHAAHSGPVHRASRQINIVEVPVAEPASQALDWTSVMLKEGEGHAVDGEFCNPKDDQPNKQSGSHAILEAHRPIGLGGMKADKTQEAVAEAEENKNGLECDTPTVGGPCATCDDHKATEEGGSLESMLSQPIPNLEINLNEPTPNLMLSLNEASCKLGEEKEAPKQMFHTTQDTIKARAVDGSIKESLSEDLITETVRTLGDILSNQSPLEVIVFGTKKEPKPQREPAIQPGFKGEKAQTSNLARLGFRPLCSASLSIYEQVKAHMRAQLGAHRKQECEVQFQLPPTQAVKAKPWKRPSPWHPSTSGSSRSPLADKLRELLNGKEQCKKLSPILEISPELSPSCFSAVDRLSNCSSKSI